MTPRSGRVKEARKLQRRAVRAERGLFLAEGAKSLAEALGVPGCVREVFAADAAYDDPTTADVLRACATAGVVVRRCEASVIEALADTVTPQGVVAVCAEVSPVVAAGDLSDRLRDARLVVVCADVRDPGNAGTVIRCADAAGADAVVLAGSSVDPHNAKTVRATVGSLFHLPVLRAAGETLEAVAALQQAGLQVLAADGGGEVDLDDAADDGVLARPTAWLMGNEAWGLPEELAAAADARVAIPIHGRAESLNLATAAAVCLYASARALRRRTVQR
ncbi:RNA methyltransferase [Nocardioidaceae bacterium]|nr:RNA methyltransferase [Nocardioidaceae bacterium]